MRIYNIIGVTLFFLFSSFSLFAETVNFDFNWKFALLPCDTSRTENWRCLDLPHDWSIEGQYAEQNGDWQSGFLPCGTGVYRKHFDAPRQYRDKVMKIMFDGIYRCSDVWINGHHLGFRPNGFLGIEYDLTAYLKDKNNLLEVRVDHSRHLSSRSYSGSGIYRHVWLKILDKVHIATSGIDFSSYDVSADKAGYKVSVEVVNKNTIFQDCELVISITGTDGKIKDKNRKKVRIAPNSTSSVSFEHYVENIELWHPVAPHLYNLNVEVLGDGQIRDCTSCKVGFRSVAFEGERGLILNGEPIKIKGVCERSTAGAFGAAVPDDVLHSKVKLLKEMGCNAIRTAHHPFSPEFYDICDSLGIMVMDEIFDGWEAPKAAADYGLYFEEWWRKDITDFVKRDRSRACVILWSIGNEVYKPTRETQQKIINLFKELDPTRLTTQGGHDPTRGMEGDEIKTQLGVKGFNGDGEEIGTFERFHAKFPDVPIIGTEVPHTLHTRGVYRTRTHWRRFDFPAVWEQTSRKRISRQDYLIKMHPILDLTEKEVFPEEVATRFYQNGNYYPIKNNLPLTTYYQSSYDNASVRISARDSWLEAEKNAYISGIFRWTGFDYLGESNGWPSRFMNCGVIDICGFPKDHFYLYQSLWTDEPMVHILPHWTHQGKEGVDIPVVVYTNAEKVELFLNGKSLGRKDNNRQQMVWNVPYEKGELKALAYTKNNMVACASQKTAENSFSLRLSADKPFILPDNKSIVQISVHVNDRQGVLCPLSDNEVEFHVTGGAEIVGVDNGDPLDLSDYKTNRRKAFRGKAMLWIQSNGRTEDIVIRAVADGLREGKIIIPVKNKIDGCNTALGGERREGTILINCEKVVKTHVNKGIASANLCWLLDSDKKRPNPHRSMKEALSDLGVGSLRFPYGHLADNYLWNVTDDNRVINHLNPKIASDMTQPAGWKWAVNADGTFINAMDFDEYVALCRDLNAIPLVVVNALSFKYKNGPTLDQLVESAKAWVKYAKAKEYNIGYWQIGNEVDHHGKLISKREYVDTYKKIASGMKEVDPDIKVGPGILSKSDYMTLIYNEAPELIDFTSCHQYMFAHKDSCGTYEEWRGIKRTFIPNVIKMKQAVDKLGKKMDIVLTETGVTGSGLKENNVFAALWWFDILMSEIVTPYISYIYFWGTHTPWGGPQESNEDIGVLFRLDDNSDTPIAKVSSLVNQHIMSNAIEVLSADTDLKSYGMIDDEYKNGTVFILNKSGNNKKVNLIFRGLKNNKRNIRCLALYGETPYELKLLKTQEENIKRRNDDRLEIALHPYSISVIRF